jgi:hypothetical protein
MAEILPYGKKVIPVEMKNQALVVLAAGPGSRMIGNA